MHKTAAGRSGEVSLLCFELLKYNPEFSCTYSSWAQKKVAKHKGVLLLPGNGRHHCVINNLADYVASGALRHKDMSDFSGDTQFLFHTLRKVDNPGSAVGDMIKGMSQESALVANKFVTTTVPAVESARPLTTPLPPRPPSFRHPPHPQGLCGQAAERRQRVGRPARHALVHLPQGQLRPPLRLLGPRRRAQGRRQRPFVPRDRCGTADARRGRGGELARANRAGRRPSGSGTRRAGRSSSAARTRTRP